VPERPSLSALSAARGPFDVTGRDLQRLSACLRKKWRYFVRHHFPSLECRWLRTGTRSNAPLDSFGDFSPPREELFEAGCSGYESRRSIEG